jgi:DNA-directed RNA polymerase subunit M/transcription elongation factor TFIIS
MDTKTMSKKRKYDNSARQAENIAGECVMCPELLKKSEPPRQQKTRVYAKSGNVRYCICANCGNTWKKVVLIESKG